MSSSDVLADGRVKQRVENYTGFWQKDMNNEAKVDTDNRVENYTDVINGMCPIFTFIDYDSHISTY